MPPKKKIIDKDIPVEEDKKEFRINAQNFALTYPRCYLTTDRVQTFIKNKRAIDHIVTCTEKHKDGTPHLHVYVRFQKKLNIKKETFFDIKENDKLYHPNIQVMKYPQKWYEYVKKDGNFIEDFNWDFLSQCNYIKRKNDFEAFKMDIFRRSLKACPKEVTLNNTVYKNEGKLRHICIVTDPDWGKTQWVEDTFEGYDIVKGNKGKYALDDYDGQEVILFDDHMPNASLLLNISNIYKTMTPIGETRYHNRYWPLYQQRWIFIFLNTIPEYMLWPNMKARFHLIDLRKHQDVTIINVTASNDAINPTQIF